MSVFLWFCFLSWDVVPRPGTRGTTASWQLGFLRAEALLLDFMENAHLRLLSSWWIEALTIVKWTPSFLSLSLCVSSFLERERERGGREGEKGRETYRLSSSCALTSTEPTTPNQPRQTGQGPPSWLAGPLALKCILSDLNKAVWASFWLVCPNKWCIFLYPFTFRLTVFLHFRCFSCSSWILLFLTWYSCPLHGTSAFHRMNDVFGCLGCVLLHRVLVGYRKWSPTVQSTCLPVYRVCIAGFRLLAPWSSASACTSEGGLIVRLSCIVLV